MKGEKHFALCMGCHMENGRNFGGVTPPMLSHAGIIYDKNYLIALLKDPAMAQNVDHLYTDTMLHPMGSIKVMIDKNQQIADTVAYLLKEKSQEATPKQVFIEACSRCHTLKQKDIAQFGEITRFKHKTDVLKYQLKLAEEEELITKYLGKTPPDLSNIVSEKSEEFIAEFIKNPQSKYHDTSMPRVGLSNYGYEKLISYLKDTSSSN